MAKMAGKTFFSKNVVAIIMVPLLLGAHYGWYKLQQVDTLVTPEERNKLPITRALQAMNLSKE